MAESGLQRGVSAVGGESLQIAEGGAIRLRTADFGGEFRLEGGRGERPGAESAPQSRSIPAANSRSIALNSPVAASWEESAAMS